MRIKQYDYDTCEKLKNQMRDVNEVKKWVEEFWEDVGFCDIYKAPSYLLNNFYCVIYDNLVLFSLNISYKTIYIVYSDSPNLVEDKELFREIKQLFLSYKLKQKLEKDLVVNEVKRKITKI